MSDIKYIIAGEDGEPSSFGCFAVVRYAVAGVVTVLAITVMALVIHAVLRSEDIGLSVNKGYIGADTLWSHETRAAASQVVYAVAGRGSQRTSSQLNKVEEPVTTCAAKPKPSRRLRGRLVPYSSEVGVGGSSESDTDVYSGATIQATLGSRGLPKDCLLGCSGGGQEPTQVTTFKKADKTNLRVVLIVSNPGGRTKIDCNGTTISLVDMAAPYGVIGDVALGNFTVPPLTTITLQKLVKNTNTSYIWENYHLASRFSVTVKVSSNVTSYPLGKMGKTTQKTYVCQPVTVGRIDDEAIYATDHVDCS